MLYRSGSRSAPLCAALRGHYPGIWTDWSIQPIEAICRPRSCQAASGEGRAALDLGTEDSAPALSLFHLRPKRGNPAAALGCRQLPELFPYHIGGLSGRVRPLPNWHIPSLAQHPQSWGLHLVPNGRHHACYASRKSLAASAGYGVGTRRQLWTSRFAQGSRRAYPLCVGAFRSACSSLGKQTDRCEMLPRKTEPRSIPKVGSHQGRTGGPVRRTHSEERWQVPGWQWN